MEKFIAAENASYSYKDGFSLDKINLEIYKEDITFITGDNGCGKSTLSRLLCGIFKPSSGIVRVENLNTKNLSLSGIGRKVGYLWQNVDVQLFCIKVWDELIFKYKLENKLTHELTKEAEAIMERFNICHIKNSSLDSISKGEKQRLALSVMLLNNNKYFIFDEPTIGLDEKSKYILTDIIKELNSKKTGFLIISHDEDFIGSLAGRIIHMKRGGIEYDKRI